MKSIQQKLVVDQTEKNVIRDVAKYYKLSQSELLRSLVRNEAIRLNMWPTPILQPQKGRGKQHAQSK